MAGVRFYGENISVEDDLYGSLRLGLRTGSRFTLWTEVIHGEPSGTYSRERAYITGLRMLGQLDLRTRGAVRPYVLAGVGGVYFNFGDRFDASFGTITGGAGVHVRTGARTGIFAEGSVDVLRAREARYSLTGYPIYAGRSYTESIAAVSLGVSVELSK